FAPGIAGGKIKCLRIGGPGEAVYFLRSAGHRKSLTTARINQVNLVDAFVFFPGVLIVRVFSVGFAIREERDPAAVRRPFRIGVMARLRELNQRAAGSVVSVQPQIFAENLPVPIGAFSANYDRISVRRQFHRRKTDSVKELVESYFRFVLSEGE